MAGEEDDEEEPEEKEPEEELDEETKERIRKEREAIAKRQSEYHEKMEILTLETFKDRPEEISEVFVSRTWDTWIDIYWNKPEDNNYPI